MLRSAATAVLLLLSLHALAQTPAAPAATTLDGSWISQPTPGHTEIRELHFTTAPDGTSTCSEDLPASNTLLPCRVVSPTNPIRLTLPSSGTEFTGTLSGSTLSGTLVGPRATFPITLTREAAPLPLTNPTRFGAAAPTTPDDRLLGGYGPARSNNDLLHYHLRLRVDPVAQTIEGTNEIRLRMLSTGSRLQLELAPTLTLHSITLHGHPLSFTREERTLWISTPKPLRRGHTYTLTVSYGGHPVAQGRFDCFSFKKDPTGKPWITTACEGDGPSVWWPNKDQWRDEPQQGVDLDIAVPNGLTDVSNGRLRGTRDLHDGYTEWRWRVTYPINNYDVALNIADYTHFSGPKHGRTTLDYYVLPADLAKAQKQFAQTPIMLDAFEHFFGEYPFARDGYKLVEVPYAGMEHQSAVAYGNHFENSYFGGDWTGVGISPRFDFMIVHESGHEWFGNSVSAADYADMWIHEGWTTYLESLYVEFRWGKADGIRYVNGFQKKTINERPILTPRGINARPPEDQYFKGALMLNTLRSILNNDPAWFADIHAFYQHFKYQNISTEDVVTWWNHETGLDLTPVFNQYLRHAAIPTLDLDTTTPGVIRYRWLADEPAFHMPIDVGDPTHWTRITPSTTGWQTLPWPGSPSTFHVATDLFYINVHQHGNPSIAQPHL